MKKIILAALAVSLSSCMSNPQEDIDKSKIICKDGIEYLSYTKRNMKGDLSFSIVPHYKNGQGELYTCGAPQ